jgi:hypothetical protein
MHRIEISADTSNPLTLVPVFEDPGPQFLYNIYLTAGSDVMIALLSEDTGHLEPLYLILEHKAHRLNYSNSCFPSDFLENINNLEKFFAGKQDIDHHIIACHCIDFLQNRSKFDSPDPYAAKYWVAHTARAAPGDSRVIHHLQQIRLSPVGKKHRLNAKDADTVLNWLLQVWFLKMRVNQPCSCPKFGN